MSLTCTRLRPRASSQRWKRSTRRSADDSFWPGCFSNSFVIASLAEVTWLAAATPASPTAPTMPAASERYTTSTARPRGMRSDVSVETIGLSSIAMMPEIRKTNSACRTAPAKIQPKSTMTGSETSWIQRGTSST